MQLTKDLFTEMVAGINPPPNMAVIITAFAVSPMVASLIWESNMSFSKNVEGRMTFKEEVFANDCGDGTNALLDEVNNSDNEDNTPTNFMVVYGLGTVQQQMMYYRLFLLSIIVMGKNITIYCYC